MKTFKILAVYHKPFPLIKNDVVEPIHAGRAMSSLNKEDKQWMLDNMIGDDTGDNISLLNASVNENTATYWAWKNYNKLGNPDYLGIMHYRRYYRIKNNPEGNDLLSLLGYTNEALTQVLKDADFGEVTKFRMREDNTYYKHYQTATAEFKDNSHKKVEFLSSAMDAIKEVHPQDYDFFSKTIHTSKPSSFMNMYILPRKEFFKYCEWLFPVLFKLREIRPEEPGKESRNVGYTAEMLTAIYFAYLEEQGKKAVELELVYQPYNPIKLLKPYKRFLYTILPFKKYKEKIKRDDVNKKLLPVLTKIGA